MSWVTHAVTLQDAASVSWMRDAGEIERDGMLLADGSGEWGLVLEESISMRSFEKGQGWGCTVLADCGVLGRGCTINTGRWSVNAVDTLRGRLDSG